MSFITQAYAETASTAGAGLPQESPLGFVMPFVLIFVVFYFLILRPQQKKIKEHQAMVSAIKRGDKVVTSGGILGKVTKVNTDTKTIDVEIAQDVEIEVLASSISTVAKAGAPVNDNGKAKAETKEKKAK